MVKMEYLQPTKRKNLYPIKKKKKKKLALTIDDITLRNYQQLV